MKQYDRKTTRYILHLALLYRKAMLDPKEASKLLMLSKDKRNHVLRSLTALSKFQGCYENWKRVREQAGLKWERRSGLEIIQSMLQDNAEKGLEWLERVKSMIGEPHITYLDFILKTGLRVDEGYKAINLIIELSREGRLNEYLDDELMLLQHFKYPKLFLRRNKNAYLSFIDKPLLERVLKIKEPKSYDSLRSYASRRGLPMQAKMLRKVFATKLKSMLDREIIDVLQGRIGASIFVKYYYRPDLFKDVRRKLEDGGWLSKS
ncbi:MAG: hypothetical protein ACUVTD_09610 [Nitrososphaerales archaeon]